MATCRRGRPPNTSFAEFIDTFEALRSEGVANPGIHRILKRLGTGSSTALIRRYKARYTAALAGGPDLELEIIRLKKQLDAALKRQRKLSHTYEPLRPLLSRLPVLAGVAQSLHDGQIVGADSEEERAALRALLELIETKTKS